MKTIHVLFGGRSTEHEISLRSARNVLNQLDRDKYDVYATFISKDGVFVPLGRVTEKVEDPASLSRKGDLSRLASIARFAESLSSDDIVFPSLHGQASEDGEIQGFLQTLGVRYVGNGITASALCMDKAFANLLMEQAGIPEARYYILNHFDYVNRPWEEIETEILSRVGERTFVKPSSNGSSVGVSKATKENLKEAVAFAFEYDNKVLIEEAISGVELEVSVLGNEDPDASLPGSYTYQTEVLDYNAKYHDKTLVENVPHPLSKEKTEEVQKLAIETYRLFGCEGLARVDIFMDQDEHFFVNEVNTLPGMTPSSLAAKLWEATDHLSFRAYLDRLIHFAERSFESRSRIQNSWEEV